MSSWEENVRRVTPYVPGEQPKRTDIIKLNTNENPYPPAPGVFHALKEFDAEELRKYPDPTVGDLVHEIATYYGLSDEEVFVGVGSDDVLAMSFLTFFNSGKPILFPDITYSFYDVWAEEFRIPYETIPLTEEFLVEISDYNKECGGIVLPNPNAPTGVAEPFEAYEKLIADHPDVVVIIDEAYVDFGANSMLPLIKKYDNLLVVQTFSKSRSLAGSRIGFAMGNPKLIQYLSDVKYSFNSYTMDRITIRLGVEAMRDKAYFEECVEKIVETREWTKERLSVMGFTFPDSQANFIFAKHYKYSAEELFEGLKEQGIYVRYFKKPRIDEYLRISIGTQEEMEKFMKSLGNYINRKRALETPLM